MFLSRTVGTEKAVSGVDFRELFDKMTSKHNDLVVEFPQWTIANQQATAKTQTTRSSTMFTPFEKMVSNLLRMAFRGLNGQQIMALIASNELTFENKVIDSLASNLSGLMTTSDEKVNATDAFYYIDEILKIKANSVWLKSQNFDKMELTSIEDLIEKAKTSYELTEIEIKKEQAEKQKLHNEKWNKYTNEELTPVTIKERAASQKQIDDYVIIKVWFSQDEPLVLTQTA